MRTQRRDDELEIIAQAWFDRLMTKYLSNYYQRGMTQSEVDNGEGTNGYGLEGAPGEIQQPDAEAGGAVYSPPG
jgi:hypothetical protein